LSRKEEKNRGNIKEEKGERRTVVHSQYPICFFSRFLLIAHILDFTIAAAAAAARHDRS
jgi:hypothetical protein